MCEFFFTAHIYAFSIGTPQQHQISKTKHLPIFFFIFFVSFLSRLLYYMNSQMMFISPSHISAPAEAAFYKSTETVLALHHKKLLMG